MKWALGLFFSTISTSFFVPSTLTFLASSSFSLARGGSIAARCIIEWTLFIANSRSDLSFKSPGDGISPNELEKVLGKKITKDYKLDETLQIEDIE